ncbi:MAG: hypothetical protein WC208_13865 [Gallionella sp.]|jgi:hypothetical protein
MGTDLSLVGAEKYVYAMDFDTGLGFNQALGHHSTITQADKNLLYKENRCRLDQDTALYLPLPISKKGMIVGEEVCIVGVGADEGVELEPSEFCRFLTTSLLSRGYRITNDRSKLVIAFGRLQEPLPPRFIIVKDDTSPIQLLSQALQVWEQDETKLGREPIHSVLVGCDRIPWEVIESYS